MSLSPEQETEIEAAVFRRLRDHLRARGDVQNIDLMNLAGFCRNCLSNWYREAAEAAGTEMTKHESRQIVYGMPYEEWRELLKAAKVRPARLHDARHTAATMLLVLKVPTRAVMDVMGWSNASMAGRYQHVPAEVLTGIADQVGGLLWDDEEDQGDDGGGGLPVAV